MKFRCAVCLVFAVLGFAAPAQTNRPFMVTHSMKYKDAVDLTPSGVPRNPILYESALLSAKDKDGLRPEASLRALAARLERGPLPTVIDIERWSIYTTNEVRRTEDRQKLLHVLDRLRGLRPDLQFGYYGVVPQNAYWPIVIAGRNPARKLQWEEFNRKAQNDFAPHVDAIFPSLYTFYEDRNGWETYARETLQAARQFNKPVHAFIWPKYHPSNKTLKGQYISREYWRLELNICRKYCDGVVIWNHEPEKNWDPAAPWWQETLAFLAELRKE